MGCSSSSATAVVADDSPQDNKEADAISNAIDARQAQDMQTDSKICKLLLLGAGESGKSTLFKQIVTIYGEGLSRQQLDQYLPSIHQLTIASMRQLARQADILTMEGTHPQCKLQSQEAEQARHALLTLPDDIILLDKEIARNINTLWNDQGIKEAFALRSSFQLVDTADYFFDRADVIAKEDYLPSYQDVLRCRVRTTGITENRFEISGHKFLLVDVGGQRNERKKWIHCFEGVTAVIFVTSLSEYDQRLFEDNFTSRIAESIALFEEVMNMKWFVKCPIILFLNKRDLFEEKLKISPLNKAFPEYQGGADFRSGIDFILKKFTDQAEGRRKEMIFSHVTCAMDTDNVQHVFDDVKEILIRKALTSTGLDTM